MCALRGGQRHVAQRVPEAHRKIKGQEITISQVRSTVAQQQKEFRATIERQQKQIKALTTSLQTVSRQLELSKAAPQLVADNQ